MVLRSAVVLCCALGVALGSAPDAEAGRKRRSSKKKPSRKAVLSKKEPAAPPPVATVPPRKHACYDELRALGVAFELAPPQVGIDLPVEVKGPLGGVTYVSSSSRKKTLILDCSLVYSLAVVGPWYAADGWTRATYSSAYQRRNVRGTNRPSNHSFGLALDVHRWQGPTPPGGKPKDAPVLSVEADFEQGLGDDVDCIGQPLTPRGRTLKTVWCRMHRSGHFRFILNPDTDAAHHDHFHLEVMPWAKRADLDRVKEVTKSRRADTGAAAPAR